ncbi:MAG: tetracycline resistance protein TetP, partial [Lactobacillus amylovorus]|nr:tetracycline resistance protein TetP [Lactobacillus amylovorus]MDY5960328.1 tetracycline resistance protein TetP [Lactobacillus amylovorus]
NAQEIIEQKNYDPVSDLENTPNSVFCSHGAGHTVTWDKVPETAHYPYTYPLK